MITGTKHGGALAALLAAGAGCGESRADTPEGPLSFERMRVEVGAPTSSILALDVDPDGRLDLLVTSNDHVVVLVNRGNGRFEVSERVHAGPGAVDVAAGDLDGDARPDLLVANHETVHVTVLFGVDGGFEARDGSRVDVDVDPHPHAVGLSDVDGDGNLDLLVDDRGRESIRVFPGRGDGTFSEAILVGVGGDPYRGFVVADVSGDGRPDLLTPNPGHVAIALGDGRGGFARPIELDAGFSPFSVAAGDFDGDGIIDLAAGSAEGPGSLAAWSGRGQADFASAARYTIAPGPTKSGTGDLDGDGRDELVVTSYLGGEVAVLVGGVLQRLPVDGYPYGVATGDFDGDGRADFAVANDDADYVSVFLTRISPPR